jgi:hypothetical protein
MSRIPLTQKQVKRLLPYFDRVRSAASLGQPGMLVAQIRWSSPDQTYWMEPGFLPHEVAQCISEKGQACDREHLPISPAGSKEPRPARSAQGDPTAPGVTDSRVSQQQDSCA